MSKSKSARRSRSLSSQSLSPSPSDPSPCPNQVMDITEQVKVIHFMSESSMSQSKWWILQSEYKLKSSISPSLCNNIYNGVWVIRIQRSESPSGRYSRWTLSQVIHKPLSHRDLFIIYFMSESKSSAFMSQSKIKSSIFQVMDVLVGVQVVSIYFGWPPTFISESKFKFLS